MPAAVAAAPTSAGSRHKYAERMLHIPDLRTRAGWAAAGMPLGGSVSDEAAQLADLAVRAYFSMGSSPYDGLDAGA